MVEDNSRITSRITFTENDLKILRVLVDTNNLTLISKRLRRKNPNTLRSLKRLVLLGFVDKRGRMYYLTSLGVSKVSKKSYPRSRRVQGEDNYKVDPVRLHDISFTLSFIKIPEGWDQRRRTCFSLSVDPEVLEAKFNGAFRGGGSATIRFLDYTIMCYSKSVRIWIPEVIDIPSKATRRAFQYLGNVVPVLENRLGIPRECLLKEGRLNVRLSSSHYAIMDSEFSKWVINDKDKSKFIVNGDDGRLRVLVDRSDGYETESITADKGEEDITKLQDYFNDVIEGRSYRPSEIVEILSKSAGVISSLNPVLVDLNSNIESHVSLVKSINKASEDLAEAVKTLKEVSEVLKNGIK